MPAGRGMGMMPPSTPPDACLCAICTLITCFRSGTPFIGPTTNAFCAPRHAGTAAWIQASRLSWHSVPSTSRLCRPTSWVSLLPAYYFLTVNIYRSVSNLLNENRPLYLCFLLKKKESMSCPYSPVRLLLLRQQIIGLCTL